MFIFLVVYIKRSCDIVQLSWIGNVWLDSSSNSKLQVPGIFYLFERKGDAKTYPTETAFPFLSVMNFLLTGSEAFFSMAEPPNLSWRCSVPETGVENRRAPF